jgi:hypothetical protein
MLIFHLNPPLVRTSEVVGVEQHVEQVEVVGVLVLLKLYS